MVHRAWRLDLCPGSRLVAWSLSLDTLHGNTAGRDTRRLFQCRHAVIAGEVLLPECQDQLAAQYVTSLVESKAPFAERSGQLVPRIMSDVLIGIAARLEESIKLFGNYPFPAGIIRSAQHEPAAI